MSWLGRAIGPLLIVCLALGVPWAAAEEPIVLGVLAYRGAEQAASRWSATADFLAASPEIGQAELVPLTLEAVRSEVAAGGIDFLITNPGNYVELAETHGLTKIATLETDGFDNRATGNRFGAVIFTRAERNDLNSLADLKGKRLAAIAPDAFGGFQLARFELIRQGVEPFTDLAGVSFLGFPQDAVLSAVLTGQADAGTMRTGLIERMVAEGRLDPDRIKLLNARAERGFDFLLSSALYPEWAFAALPHTSLALRERVAVALYSMPPDSEAARRGGYAGWTTPLGDQSIRALFRSLGIGGDPHEAGPEQGGLRWLAGAGLLLALTLGAVALSWRLRRHAPARPAEGPAAASEPTNSSHCLMRLSPREREVVGLVVAGEPNKRIAYRLGISPKTVEFHRANVMRKLDVHSVAELVRLYFGAGPWEAASDEGSSPPESRGKPAAQGISPVRSGGFPS